MKKVGALLAKLFFGILSTMTFVSAIDDTIQRKIRGRGVVRAGKEITLVTSNEDIDDVIRIIKSLVNSGILLDGVRETVKHEVKKPERGFLGMLLETLGASVFGNILTRKGVMRAGKGVAREARGYNNMNPMKKNF